MPRSLALLAALALPFLARDPGEPTGGAAVAENPAFDPGAFETPNPFDRLMAHEGGPSLDESPFSFMEDPVASAGEGEGEATGEAAAEGQDKGESADAPALPEKVDVDGAEVPMADLMEAYKGREAAAQAVESAGTYDAMIESFFAGPEGAADVIRVMMEKAHLTYAEHDPKGFEEAFGGIGVPAPLPEDFDEATATPNERALVAQNAALQRKIGAMTTEFQRTLDGLKGEASAKALDQAGDAHAATVNAKVPGARVDGPTIARMMRETGLSDPVKAYKLASYDKAAESARKEPEAKSTMPRGQGAPKTFDPNDPRLTVDQMARLMELGHVPVKAK